MVTKLDRIKQIIESKTKRPDPPVGAQQAQGPPQQVRAGDLPLNLVTQEREVVGLRGSLGEQAPRMVWQTDDANFFTENRQRIPERKPAAPGAPLGDGLDGLGKRDVRRDDSAYYISAINTKRNPDLIIPGGAIKGNMYFRRHIDPDKEEQQMNEEDSQVFHTVQETGDDEDCKEDDMFSKMKNQMARYYIEFNPTIKCRNCKEFGHMAKECPNERSRPNCILCGKDTHDSFECDAKLCFKCNKVGHKANECNETNVMKCLLCGQIGHERTRCLKVWTGEPKSEVTRKPQGRYAVNSSVNRHKRCIECHKPGHLKCLSERKSNMIHLSFKVESNLDEFLFSETDHNIQYQVQDPPESSQRKASQHQRSRSRHHQKHRRLQNSNSRNNPSSNEQSRGSSSSRSYSSSSYSSDEYDSQSRSSGHHRRLRLRSDSGSVIQCSHCAEYHETSECQNKRGPGRYQQYENVRNRFAKDIGFNYRRGHEPYSNEQQHQQVPQQSMGGNRGHHRSGGEAGNRYDDRRVEYHHSNSYHQRSSQHNSNSTTWQDTMIGKRGRDEGNNRIDFHHTSNQMPSKRMKYGSSNGNGYGHHHQQSSSAYDQGRHQSSSSGTPYNHRVGSDPRIRNMQSQYSQQQQQQQSSGRQSSFGHHNSFSNGQHGSSRNNEMMVHQHSGSSRKDTTPLELLKSFVQKKSHH